MSQKIVVLGAGMVGSVIAEDLHSSGFHITIVDINSSPLKRIAEHSNGAINIHEADCSDVSAIQKIAQTADLVVGALPSWLGLNALKTVIELGKSYCDISFMSEDPRQCDDLAKEYGVTCVVDFGVAPGMSHLLCAHAVSLLDTCDSLDIAVGGLPVARDSVWDYKAPFSPRDVIEEYLRPARLVENGKIVIRPALSDIELVDLPTIGQLEAFNSDGLRTLCDTLEVPEMRERTLRYPGHAKIIQLLRDAGFFNSKSIFVSGQETIPLDFTAKILIDSWKYEQGEADLTVMRVEAKGAKDDKPMLIRWDLLDYYDAKSKQSSMGRTTAFPLTSIARMIIDGTINTPGVHPPEFFGNQQRVINRLFKDLEERNVRYIKTMEFLK